MESAKTAGCKITLIDFEGEREFLHKYIHRAHELPDVIREFIEQGLVEQRGKNRLRSEREGIHLEEELSTNMRN